MTSVEHIRSKISELIEKHDSTNAHSVDPLMKKWKGKENDLLKTLCNRYNEKFEKMKPLQIKSVYSIGGKLGTGGFAVVRKCKRRVDGKVFALKVINKKNLDKEDLVVLDNEVQIMRKTKHVNIVQLYDVFDSRSKMCLVIDLLEGGELFDRIIEVGHFTEKVAANAFGQMLSALQYLHKMDIVHRDLKPENLLFQGKSNDSAIKLIDFGLAGSCKEGPLKTPCGTPNYVAPEILRRQGYGTKVDMWSIGVILYILLCGFPPFYDDNDDLGKLYRKIKRADYDMPSPYWDDISNLAKDLVKKLLNPNPKLRLTATQTLEHQWLKGLAPDRKIGNLSLLRKFQYISRVKRGVRCILAVVRLIAALKEIQKEAEEAQSKKKKGMFK